MGWNIGKNIGAAIDIMADVHWRAVANYAADKIKSALGEENFDRVAHEVETELAELAGRAEIAWGYAQNVFDAFEDAWTSFYQPGSSHEQLAAATSPGFLAFLACDGSPTPPKTFTSTPKTSEPKDTEVPPAPSPSSFEFLPLGNCYDQRRCFIPEGSFMMAAPDLSVPVEKTPQKRVFMSAFWIGKTEVTVGDYKKHLKQSSMQLTEKLRQGLCGKLNQQGDNYPIACLTMIEQRAYCKSQGGDLPTAAQLERAMRGPRKTDDYGTPIDKAINKRNGYKTTAPVCTEGDGRANGFGVCDLFGNLAEGSLDAFDFDWYIHLPDEDPHNPITNFKTQIRATLGGSYASEHQRSPTAYGCDATLPGPHGFPDVGFRCAWPYDSKK